MSHPQTLRDAMYWGVQTPLNAAGAFSDCKGMISDFSTDPYTLNESFWLKAFNTSGYDLEDPNIDPHNGALVHPRIYWTAAHYAEQTVVVTDRNTGEQHEFDVIDFRNVGDIGVRLIAQTSTDYGITPFKVFGPNCLAKISEDGYGAPILITNQFREFCVKKISQLSGYSGNGFGTNTPTDHLDWYAYYQPSINHDSGSPAFVVIRGELVFVGHLKDSSAAGPSACANFTAVNAAMNEMLLGASLTELDASGFPDLVNGDEPMDWTDNKWQGNTSSVLELDANWQLGHFPTAVERAYFDGNDIPGNFPVALVGPASCGALYVSAMDPMDLGNLHVVDVEINATAVDLGSFAGRVVLTSGATLAIEQDSDSGDMPDPADVRAGTTYHNETEVGTLEVGGTADSFTGAHGVFFTKRRSE